MKKRNHSKHFGPFIGLKASWARGGGGVEGQASPDPLYRSTTVDDPNSAGITVCNSQTNSVST